MALVRSLAAARLSASTMVYPFWSLGVPSAPLSVTDALAPNGAPPSTRAGPTRPIQSPHAFICSSAWAGVKSAIGVAGPR